LNQSRLVEFRITHSVWLLTKIVHDI
jgi:hypothetical protein